MLVGDHCTIDGRLQYILGGRTMYGAEPNKSQPEFFINRLVYWTGLETHWVLWGHDPTLLM
jgi:hypothetical protein